VTASQSDTAATSLEALAAALAEAVGGTFVFAHGTAKVRVEKDRWVEALRAARDDFGLIFFSWLSAVDWSNQVEVGDALTEPVEERYEVIAAVADISTGLIVLFSTDLEKDNPRLASLVGVYAGANWHEREAHEMFGIEFEGHPQLIKLYLPEGFLGHPLRKSYPLLSREVKPWPGKVDVEGMPGQDDEEDEPSTENPEA
jgi:NADH-quinone oxidoreductase subunit C